MSPRGSAGPPPSHRMPSESLMFHSLVNARGARRQHRQPPPHRSCQHKHDQVKQPPVATGERAAPARLGACSAATGPRWPFLRPGGALGGLALLVAFWCPLVVRGELHGLLGHSRMVLGGGGGPGGGGLVAPPVLGGRSRTPAERCSAARVINSTSRSLRPRRPRPNEHRPPQPPAHMPPPGSGRRRICQARAHRLRRRAEGAGLVGVVVANGFLAMARAWRHGATLDHMLAPAVVAPTRAANLVARPAAKRCQAHLNAPSTPAMNTATQANMATHRGSGGGIGFTSTTLIAHHHRTSTRQSRFLRASLPLHPTQPTARNRGANACDRARPSCAHTMGCP